MRIEGVEYDLETLDIELKEQAKAARRAEFKQFYKRDWSKYTLWRTKSRCKEKNIPFNLDYFDIVLPEFCPILGIKLVLSKGSSTPCSPSLDRIIPIKGYVKGNVHVISNRANSLKNDATPDELRKIADYIEKITEGKE